MGNINEADTKFACRLQRSLFSFSLPLFARRRIATAEISYLSIRPWWVAYIAHFCVDISYTSRIEVSEASNFNTAFCKIVKLVIHLVAFYGTDIVTQFWFFGYGSLFRPSFFTRDEISKVASYLACCTHQESWTAAWVGVSPQAWPEGVYAAARNTECFLIRVKPLWNYSYTVARYVWDLFSYRIVSTHISSSMNVSFLPCGMLQKVRPLTVVTVLLHAFYYHYACL